jgi:hypothetical protein
MRTTAVFVLAFFLFAAPALGQVEFVQNKTDEFTGERVVQTAYEGVTVQQSGDEALTLSRSSVLYADEEWALSVATKSDSWALLGTDTAYFLADGERFETKLHRQTGETQDYGGVYEEHFVLLSEEMRSVFSQASQVRMKAGQYVFDITDAVDDEIEAIQSEI